MHPFTGLATREDGAIKVCCRSLPIGWIQDESLESAWNNENMIRIRQDILEGRRPAECEPCFSLEDQGVESLRQRHINGVIPEARINLYPRAIDAVRSDYTMPFEFPTIEIKLNNLCNLKCRMCNPLDSTQWQDWDQVKPFYERENNYLVPTVLKLVDKPGQYIGPFDNSNNWWESFERLLPHFRRVEFAGGEPLMDPTHYRILDMLKQCGSQIEIKYATNGTVLGINKGRTIFDYWPHFKSVAVNVSIDGVGDVYNYIRSNSDFALVEQNIKQIQTIPNVSRIVGAFTAQAGNILQAAHCVEYFMEKLGIIFYSHRVSYPNCLSAQVLPPELKKIAINRLSDVRGRVSDFDLVIKNPILEQIVVRQIDDNINYLLARDQSHLWSEFLQFNKNLDKTRNQDLLSAVPEFIDYV